MPFYDSKKVYNGYTYDYIDWCSYHDIETVWFSCSEIVKKNEDYVKEVLTNAGNQKRNA